MHPNAGITAFDIPVTNDSESWTSTARLLSCLRGEGQPELSESDRLSVVAELTAATEFLTRGRQIGN